MNGAFGVNSGPQPLAGRKSRSLDFGRIAPYTRDDKIKPLRSRIDAKLFSSIDTSATWSRTGPLAA